jgi:hypothetical protein
VPSFQRFFSEYASSATGTVVDFGAPAQREPGAVALRLEGVFF